MFDDYPDILMVSEAYGQNYVNESAFGIEPMLSFIQYKYYNIIRIGVSHENIFNQQKKPDHILLTALLYAASALFRR